MSDLLPSLRTRRRSLSLTCTLLVFSVASHADIRSILDIRVEMRDGVGLLTDVYLPEGDGPFPVVLSRVPYGTKTDYIFQPAVGEYFASRGFAYVSQNVRGRFGSEGLFTAYMGGKEEPDAYDTVDWIVAQEWSNGNVGVMGESYYGYTTLMAAASGHAAIKAISPANITLAREKQTLDGAFPLQASGLWTLDMDDAENGEYQDTSQIDLTSLPLITMGERYGLRDVLWRNRVTGYSADPHGGNASAADYYRRIEVPTLHFGGWYDSFTRGTIALWNGIRATSDSEITRDRQWMVLGPWDHDGMSIHISGQLPPTNIGRREIGSAATTTYGETLVEFFNFFLKGEDNGFGDRKRVHYFNIGDNQWRDSDSWPPAGVDKRALYLRSDGSLSVDPPQGDGNTSFAYDPENPVSITATTNVWGRAAGLPDRQVLLARDDVVVFQTGALSDDLEITGPIVVELHAASSAPDTDFTAALVDVYPDGYSLLIQEGILRASFRQRDAEPSNIEPGEIYRFDVDLWATSYTVPAGHTLRLEISSSNFPRFTRNLNNGEAFGMSDVVNEATQTIHHSAAYPSRLLLPVKQQ